MVDASEIQQQAGVTKPVEGYTPPEGARGAPDPIPAIAPAGAEAPAAVAVEAASDWKQMIPEEFRDMPDIKDAKTAKDFLNNYAYYRNKVGKSIVIPDAETSSEERKIFLDKLRTGVPELLDMPDADDSAGLSDLYQRLGTPPDKSGYESPTFEMEPGVEMNTAQIEQFKDIALKYNLTKSQFQGVVQDYLGAELEAANAGQLAFNADMSTLHKDWGQAFDYKKEQAGVIAREFFPHSNLAEMIENGTVSAGSLRDLQAMSTQLGAEGQQLVGQVSSAGANTPGELRDQAAELMVKIQAMNPGEQRQRAIDKRITLLEAAGRNS